MLEADGDMETQLKEVEEIERMFGYLVGVVNRFFYRSSLTFCDRGEKKSDSRPYKKELSSTM